MIYDFFKDDDKNSYLYASGYQKARSERLKIDGYTCQMCGSTRELDVHHTSRQNNDDPNPLTDLVTLCRPCHERIEQTIKSKEFKEGEFDFTIISAMPGHFDGSENMEECDRIRIQMVVWANFPLYSRYVYDNLPLLDSFAWKWRELLKSVGLPLEPINTDMILDSLRGKHGVLRLMVKQGDFGPFNCVEHYLESNIPF